MFGALGDGAAYQLGTSSGSSQQILAHVNVQRRMLDVKSADAPTDTYFIDKYTLYRFFNNQAIQIFHMPRRDYGWRQRRLLPGFGCDRDRRHL